MMPDARQNGRPKEPFDFESSKKYLVPHVGYLRYNLADAGVPISPAGRGGTPSYEVIHRFNFDDLDFGFGFDEPMEQRELHLPNLRELAPTLRTKPGLFSQTPPDDLLMRTILRGGSLTTRPNGGLWQIRRTLSSNGTTAPPYLGEFAGFATWRRFVFDDEIVLRVRDWNGTEKDVIRLRPFGRDRVVRLKIANLCAENPLEWPELYLRMFSGDADDDFRWFYRLLEDTRGDFKDLLGPSRGLPVPEPIQAHGDLTNCTGSRYLVESVEGS